MKATWNPGEAALHEPWHVTRQRRARLLLIEDDPADAALFREYLLDTGDDLRVEHAESLADALRRLDEEPYDLVVTDLSLSDAFGLEALERLASHRARTPFVVLSGNEDEELALRCLELGAKDFLVKRHVTEFSLRRSVLYALDRVRIEQRYREANDVYRTIVASTIDGIWMIDAQARTVYVNDRLLAMLGYERHQMHGVSVFDFAADGYVDVAREKFQLRSEGVAETHEFPFRHANGFPVWTLASAAPITRPDGSFAGAVAILKDLTSVRSVLKELERTRERQWITSEQLSGVLEASPHAIYVLDRDGIVQSWNPAAQELFGWTAAETIGRTLPTVPQDDLDRFRHLLDTAAAGARHRGVELKRLRKDGRVVYVSLATSAVRDAGGAVTGILNIVEDITERRRTEELLRMQQRALESVASGITIVDAHAPDMPVVYVNEAFERMTGYTAQETIGRNCRFLQGPDTDAASLDVIRTALATRTGCEVVLRNHRKDGTPFWNRLVISPVHDDDGIVTHFVGVQNDITAALERTEQVAFQASLLDQVENAVIATDLEHRVTYWNRHAAELYGYAAAETLGRPLREFVVPENELEIAHAAMGEVRNSGAWSGEYYVRDRTGRRFPVHVSVTALTNDDGKVTGFIGASFDITERKHEEALEAQRSRVLEMITERAYLGEILEAITSLADEHSPHPCALHLARDGFLVPAVAPGMPPAYLEELECNGGIRIAHDEGPCGRAASRGETVVVTDVSRDVRHEPTRALFLRHGLQAVWSVPIVLGDGSVRGVFATYARDVGAPTPAQLDALQSTARLAAIAIEHDEAIRALAFQAEHDSLTGLLSRRAFTEGLEVAARQERPDGSLCVLFVDLDRFKETNDTFGHAAGDAVLQEVARRLQACVRGSDAIARVGGDEFAILVDRQRSSLESVGVARRILGALEQPFDVEDREVYLSATIGISTFPQDGRSASELLARADAAMYEGKQSGKNTFTFFTPEMNARAHGRIALEARLRRALKNDEFVLHYQPKVDLASGAVAGVEALVRWIDPERGIVPPGEFIPVAEETGLIVPLGSHVLLEACRQAARWANEGRPLPVSVNVSALQLGRPDFVEVVREALRATKIDPSLVTLEVTESYVTRDLDAVTMRLAALRVLGVRISLDDFGTGYSALAYLRALPLHELKIDRTFIRDASQPTSDRDTVRVLESIIAIAQALRLEVVAEGIETPEQAELLREFGCNVGQGYLFSKPVPATDIPFGRPLGPKSAPPA